MRTVCCDKQREEGRAVVVVEVRNCGEKGECRRN